MTRYTWVTHPRHRVFINGTEWPDVLQCDDEQGWLEFYPRNEGGHFILDPRSDPADPEVYTELRWGTITVEPLDPVLVEGEPGPRPVTGGSSV